MGAGAGVWCAAALRWFKAGKLPVPACQAGRLIVIGSAAPAPAAGTAVVCACVSSAGRRAGLDRQVARVTAWAAGQRLAVGRVVTVVGSAPDGKRREFLALLRGELVAVLVVGHRDRFARSVCARLYGKRAAAGRARRAVAAITGPVS